MHKNPAPIIPIQFTHVGSNHVPRGTAMPVTIRSKCKNETAAKMVPDRRSARVLELIILETLYFIASKVRKADENSFSLSIAI